MITVDIKKLLTNKNSSFELNIKLDIRSGSFITLFGKSGSGKTTVLKIIAGLINPEEGYIKVNDAVWLDTYAGINLPPQKRRVGFVFQEPSLFPHMTVEENIIFGMEKKDKKFLEELLTIMDLVDLKHRKPDTLSGGQKQRVAIARAVARKPEILLLDEPMSAIDIYTRKKLQEEIRAIHKQFNLTTILVSHDFSEIFKLSDMVFVLSEGKIVKSGKPYEVFVQEKISGKVKFNGIVLDIKKEDVVFIVTVLVENTTVKVVAVEEEIKGLNIGDDVIIATKAFNPFILKTEI